MILFRVSDCYDLNNRYRNSTVKIDSDYHDCYANNINDDLIRGFNSSKQTKTDDKNLWYDNIIIQYNKYRRNTFH